VPVYRTTTRTARPIETSLLKLGAIATRSVGTTTTGARHFGKSGARLNVRTKTMWKAVIVQGMKGE
jgi:hypothetical protein